MPPRRRPTPPSRPRRRRPKTPPPAPPSRLRVGAIARWTVRGVTTLAFAVVVGWVVLFYAYAPDLPDTDALFEQPSRPGLTFLAADGSVLGRRGAYQARLVELDEVAPSLVDAVIATEDRRFDSHFGIDPIGIARAALANLQAGAIAQGGSTITQQLAKNLFLSGERSLDRKIREMILAVWLETRLTKDEILTLYLNRVYLGAGAYGVEAAAQRYFGKSAAELDLAESALIAGLLKAPSRLAPTSDLEAARERAAVVLRAMVDAGALSAERAAAADRTPAEPVVYAEAGDVGWFLDWVTANLPEDWRASGRNLEVHTTLDPALQRAASEAVRRRLAEAGGALEVGQAAVVAIDRRGRVKAMIGGSDYRTAPFNRAVDARRQPGSAFKPVVYLAALQAGWRPEMRVVDLPLGIGGYEPTNYDGRYLGEMTLEEALVRSRNTVAVRLLEDVGRRKIISTARLLGITSELPANASLALGSGETSLIELSAAYTPVITGGRLVEPHGIERIEAGGDVVLEAAVEPGQPFLSGETVAMMDRMLKAVVARGTGRRADPGDRVVGGKTGTSQGWRDAWFIGYSHDLVVGVWTGNDDNAPMAEVNGGQLPAALFAEIMRAAPPPAAPVARAPSTTPAEPEMAT
ncbi:MAG: transglycosylase domain-containing protein, partial [Alphaproteobacteria bacterium]